MRFVLREYDIINDRCSIMPMDAQDIQDVNKTIVCWNELNKGRLAYTIVPDSCVKKLFPYFNLNHSMYVPYQVFKFWKDNDML
jgi:hypothetical protein